MHGIEGLHHVAAIAGKPQTNINLNTGVFGVRLVKRTVDFDDPTPYRLYDDSRPIAQGLTPRSSVESPGT
jgi:catechol 2,3-dioxygenase-like lactoylglutathione lyase family enzyme